MANFKGKSRSFLVMLAALSLIGSGSALTASADEPRPSDNSGKQIASVIPGMPKPHVVPRPQFVPAPKPVKLPREIKVVIPRSVDDAANSMWVQARKLGKTGSEKATEVGKWFAALWRQINSPPTMTPAGSPYVYQNNTQGPRVSKLFYTPEGRLKTVVKQ